MVDVNGSWDSRIAAPFGGYKHSGYWTRSWNSKVLIEFLEVKTVGGWA